MKAATPAQGRGHGRPGQGPHQDNGPRDRPEPLTDTEVRELGFEPGHRGWRPLTQELNERLAAADARRTDRSKSYVNALISIPGLDVPCAICDRPAAASSVGTPTCSGFCADVLFARLLERIGDELYTQPDGSGGRSPRLPVPPRPRKRRSVVPTGRFSVERALERLGDCRTVLERHGVDVRWGRTARCPFHEDRSPSLSLYEHGGKSRAHCHAGCGDWDPLDLEAALAGEDLPQTIRRWGSE